MDNLLEVRDLSIYFGGLVAVDQVTFNLVPGEILGLIGPNGAGKTTIFNMITGFYAPSHGEVVFRGEPITSPKRSWRERLPGEGKPSRGRNLSPHEITQKGIARTFQTIRLFKTLTVLENVMAGLHHRTRAGVWGALARPASQKREESFIHQESEKLLRFMELWPYRYELAKNLPYGDQRRLEIARGLATGPALLILDEPAAGLNEQETIELEDLVRLIRDSGVTILLIEHDMRMVMGLCERIVVVDHGRKIAEGVPAEIQRNPQVIKAYLGEEV